VREDGDDDIVVENGGDEFQLGPATRASEGRASSVLLLRNVARRDAS
jgi:hypothetical protein